MPIYIQDLAYNTLLNGSTSIMTGFETTGSETLNLDMYRFILGSIRKEDKNKGNLFLKRFMEGPQNVWRTTHDKIHAIKDLTNILEIEDEHLQYLKSIVGWTSALDHITDEVNFRILRRLIDNAVIIWKQRGKEDALLTLLTIIADTQSRMWNWFDIRWILDQTILTEQHQGRDSYLFELPGSPSYEEYYSNLRIIDDGTLNHTLVKDVCHLMRACSERIRISYIDFLELFLNEGDNHQWEATTGELVVEDGVGKLEDTGTDELALCVDDLADYWKNYNFYTRLQVTETGSAKVGIGFYYHYLITFSVTTGLTYLYQFAKDGASLILRDTGTLFEPIYSDVWYGLRVQVQSVLNVATPYVKIQAWLSNNQILDFEQTIIEDKDSDSAPETEGTIFLYSEQNTTLTIDEVEMFQLPLDTDLVDINE